MGWRVVVLSSSASNAKKNNGWGLQQDAKLIEQMLRECHAGGHHRIDSVDHIDQMSFFGSGRRPKPVDIQIHLEVPCRGAWPWAKVNIVVVNPERWPKTAWDWALAPKEKGGADMIVFKSEHARKLFPEVDDARVRVIVWRTGADLQQGLHMLAKVPLRQEFLYLVGDSVNKLAAAKVLCAQWKESWPLLTVVGTDAVRKQLADICSAPNIRLQEPFATEEARIKAQIEYGYHVVASEAEGFGFTFAEAAAVGALPLWTTIPVYNELYGNVLGTVGSIQVKPDDVASTYRDGALKITDGSIEKAVESLLGLTEDMNSKLRGQLKHMTSVRTKEFRNGWRQVLRGFEGALRKMKPLIVPPTPLPVAELPHVAVITITRNRPRWFANMAQNILKSDYPPDKFTWVVADDGDGMGRVDEAIMKFQSANPYIRVKYVSIPRPMTVGAKRNKACDAAPAEATVFVMMDDDDHYPVGSIAGRIAWLKATGAECVYCSTLPMYQCTQYISAMNVPPLDLAPSERVSEASLCFTRKFYDAQKFPGPAQIAEGEGFLEGRIEQTAEIGPEGIIVSFLHGGNTTSRRIPEQSEPNGCHYGFTDQFFTYLSQF